VCSHTPIVHLTTISRFPYKKIRISPLIFCQHTIHQVIWPSLGNLGPSICVGDFCGASSCSRAVARLPDICRSKRHHWCAMGEPACTWFCVHYQRWRPPELSFCAITLQSKVHNAVRYFNIGPHCVPIQDIKRSKGLLDVLNRDTIRSKRSFWCPESLLFLLIFLSVQNCSSTQVQTIHSKLESHFSLKRGKRDVGALSLELLKMTPQVVLAVQKFTNLSAEVHMNPNTGGRVIQ